MTYVSFHTDEAKLVTIIEKNMKTWEQAKSQYAKIAFRFYFLKNLCGRDFEIGCRSGRVLSVLPLRMLRRRFHVMTVEVCAGFLRTSLLQRHTAHRCVRASLTERRRGGKKIE